MKNLILILIIGFFSCKPDTKKNISYTAQNNIKIIKADTIKFTNGFDFPVGKPNAKKYYNAQKFGENEHLGDDWNGVGGGNTDLGDPIYSIANGYVSYAENVYGGWGNVIRIVHYIDNENQIESLYAHCDEIIIKKGDYIEKGQKIGTIGNNNG
ncbi:M23 family metallopeptidase [Algibacter sp. L3A6]|uniref:M23 family metallopeptidase n=1 Tax=Algibacter sp. L3A6 TaxID=2686366 RepID=UPI001E2AA800|nr:M23 family metallopeptidase [Algibacter sp. L3A6]